MLICRLVIETLEGVEKDRKCFRMVGGVLVERKVGEVEPALTSNRDKVRFHGKTSFYKVYKPWLGLKLILLLNDFRWLS